MPYFPHHDLINGQKTTRFGSTRRMSSGGSPVALLSHQTRPNGRQTPGVPSESCLVTGPPPLVRSVSNQKTHCFPSAWGSPSLRILAGIKGLPGNLPTTAAQVRSDEAGTILISRGGHSRCDGALLLTGIIPHLGREFGTILAEITNPAGIAVSHASAKGACGSSAALIRGHFPGRWPDAEILATSRTVGSNRQSSRNVARLLAPSFYSLSRASGCPAGYVASSRSNAGPPSFGVSLKHPDVRKHTVRSLWTAVHAHSTF